MLDLKTFEKTVERHVKDRAAEEANRKIETTKKVAHQYAASVAYLLFPEED